MRFPPVQLDKDSQSGMWVSENYPLRKLGFPRMEEIGSPFSENTPSRRLDE